MASVVLLKAAQAEYNAALEWYRVRSETAAAVFEAAVSATLALIAANPQLHGFHDKTHRIAMLRRFPYVVLYRESRGRACVVAIAHTSRKPGYWKRRS